jgi:hypothetical protein
LNAARCDRFGIGRRFSKIGFGKTKVANQITLLAILCSHREQFRLVRQRCDPLRIGGIGLVKPGAMHFICRFCAGVRHLCSLQFLLSHH